MRSLAPWHAAAMLVAGFFVGQTLGGILGLVGFGAAVWTGALDRSVLDTGEGLATIVSSPFVLLPSAVGSSLGLLTVAFATPAIARVPLREALALRRTSVAALVVGPVGALACAILADQAVFFFSQSFPRLTLGALAAFSEAARVDGPAAGAAVLLAIAVIPGTCEEIFFRGAFQTALASRWRGSTAVLVTAFAFGAVHLDPPQALGAGILGVYLGFLSVRAGSVWPAVAAHVANNAAAFVSANVPSLSSVGHGTDEPIPWPVVCAAAVVLGASVTALVLASRRPQAESPMIT